MTKIKWNYRKIREYAEKRVNEYESKKQKETFKKGALKVNEDVINFFIKNKKLINNAYIARELVISQTSFAQMIEGRKMRYEHNISELKELLKELRNDLNQLEL